MEALFCPVLHAHLPFVRHPEQPEMIEERWLYEALIETYVPLLEVCERLAADAIGYHLTFSFTPTLLAMLEDELLMQRFRRHLGRLLELSDREVHRTRHLDGFHGTALLYADRLRRLESRFQSSLNGGLIGGFRRLQEAGFIEIITGCATHGFLPLMEQFPTAVHAQIAIGVSESRRHFGQAPQGIWLSECGYVPGHEALLARSGIRYFFTDAHGILHAEPRPRYGVFAPLMTEAGVAAFGRDRESSHVIWSAEEGFPGDPVYREFYRDIGHDLEPEHLGAMLHSSGTRLDTGFKYHRVTDRRGGEKLPYDREMAMRCVCEHAESFLASRLKHAEELAPLLGGRPPLFISPFDAELFGHWWFEGPEFLEAVIRGIQRCGSGLRCTTPSAYLEEFPDMQQARPAQSSWGNKGHNEVWLDGSNDWIYPHLHEAAKRMILLADTFPEAEGLRRRALNQAARELLLAQSSDWAFIMKTGTMSPYAIQRTKDHCFRFNRLYDSLLQNTLDEGWLREVESRDTLFPEMDYHVYATSAAPCRPEVSSGSRE